MSLAERFLRYVELQRAAEATRLAHGYADSQTISAYEEANELKREVLDAIRQMEGNIDE